MCDVWLDTSEYILAFTSGVWRRILLEDDKPAWPKLKPTQYLHRAAAQKGVMDTNAYNHDMQCPT